MEKLIDILKEIVAGKVEIEIDENTDIIEDLGFDSIDIVRLLSEIEEEYGVDFMELPDFLERFIVIRDIWEGIEILMEVKDAK